MAACFDRAGHDPELCASSYFRARNVMRFGYPAYSSKPLKRFTKSEQLLISTAINRGANEIDLISSSRFNGFPEHNG